MTNHLPYRYGEPAFAQDPIANEPALGVSSAPKSTCFEDFGEAGTYRGRTAASEKPIPPPYEDGGEADKAEQPSAGKAAGSDGGQTAQAAQLGLPFPINVSAQPYCVAYFPNPFYQGEAVDSATPIILQFHSNISLTAPAALMGSGAGQLTAAHEPVLPEPPREKPAAPKEQGPEAPKADAAEDRVPRHVAPGRTEDVYAPWQDAPWPESDWQTDWSQDIGWQDPGAPNMQLESPQDIYVQWQQPEPEPQPEEYYAPQWQEPEPEPPYFNAGWQPEPELPQGFYPQQQEWPPLEPEPQPAVYSNASWQPEPEPQPEIYQQNAQPWPEPQWQKPVWRQPEPALPQESYIPPQPVPAWPQPDFYDQNAQNPQQWQEPTWQRPEPEAIPAPLPPMPTAQEFPQSPPAPPVAAAPVFQTAATPAKPPEEEEEQGPSAMTKAKDWVGGSLQKIKERRAAKQEDAEAEEEAPEEEPQPVTGKRKLVSNIFNILTIVFCAVVIVGAVIFANSDNPEKNIFGFRFYNVLTESMIPTEQVDGSTPEGGFYPGDSIIVKLANPQDVKAGDIITFNPSFDSKSGQSSAALTHRCIEVKHGLTAENPDELYFVTKGDHNKDADPPIPAEALIGIKVATVPKIGGVIKTAQKHLVLTIAFCVIVVAFLFTLFYYFSKPQAKKRGKAGQQPAVQAKS
ncbi:MAG: signal peptidase I [Oscillospiraceae bacterium]|jgi:signal peptidase I|nr:signal peptidase I [Oscillospiraceae bacterium]